MKKFLIILIVLTALPLYAGKLPVAIRADAFANSATLLRLTDELKALIIDSPQMELVEVKTPLALQLQFVSLNFEDKPMSVYGVSYTVIWLDNPYFINEFLLPDVGYVGNQQVESTARSIFNKMLRVIPLYGDVIQRMIAYKENHR